MFNFDDGLLSQYNIALPVLNKLKIKAFWFIFLPISNQHYELEIFRKYRAEYFYNIKNFYIHFFKYLNENEENKRIIKLLKRKDFKFYLKEHKFYTNLDRKFRYFRDKVYGVKKYNKIMYKLISNHKINIKKLNKNLWIKKDQIKNLSLDGHGSVCIHLVIILT